MELYRDARAKPRLVEHWLPTKDGFRPYKQQPHRFNSTIYDRVKEEINRLLCVGFIQPCRYAEWVSNIMPIEKKDSRKIRVSIDVTLQLKDNIECIHLMCAPGIVAHISR
jgi:hypothetical protein